MENIIELNSDGTMLRNVNKDVTHITIPNSVRSIDSYAFIGCDSLQSICVSEDHPVFSSLDGVLFNKDKTTLVKVPQTIESYSIPDGVTLIDKIAFYGCDSLKEIYIPNSLRSIGSDEFKSCNFLQSIYVSEDNPVYSSVDGVLFDKDKTMLIKAPQTIDRCSIPNSVTLIGARAFFFCRCLQCIDIPNSVTSIGDYAFCRCWSLQSIDIPNSVTSIGDGAFCHCESLNNVAISNSVSAIGSDVFEHCGSLQSIRVSEDNPVYSSVDGVLFNKDKTTLIKVPQTIEKYSIPDSVTLIEEDAFSFCKSLHDVEIPNSVVSIGGWAFSCCDSLISVSIPNSVVSIGTGAFWWCGSLTSVYIPNSVTKIEEEAFAFCDKLNHVAFQSDELRICKDCFEDCENLETVIFSGEVSIEDSAFHCCKKLRSIEVNGRIIIREKAFYECGSHVSNQLSRYKTIERREIIVPGSSNSAEMPTYLAYDGSLYWMLNNKYEKLFSCAFPEIKCLTRNLYVVKDGDYWRLFIPGSVYSPESNYYNAHKFESCEAVSVFNDIVILRDNHKLYIWQVYKRILSEKYYDSIEATQNSVFSPPMIVFKSGFYGLVDRNGYEILDCQYSSIHRFAMKCGVIGCDFKLEKSGKYGAYAAHVLLEPRYDDVELCNGYLIVSENGYKGIVHFDGTSVLRSIYEEIYDFSCEANKYESEYIVKKDDRYGIVNSKEEIVLPIEYDTIIRVFSNDDMYSYFDDYEDEDGNIRFVEGKYRVHDVAYQRIVDGKNVLSDQIDGWHSYLKSATYHCYICQKDGRWGLVDAQLNELIPFEYDGINIDELRANIDGWGRITDYYIRCFVKTSSGWGIRDMKDIFFPCEADKIVSYNKHRFYVIHKPDGMYTIDYHGKRLSDNFSRHDTFMSGTFLIVSLNGMKGLLNYKGEMIIPCQYEDIRIESNLTKRIVVVLKDGQCGAWCFNPYDKKWEHFLPCEYDDILEYDIYGHKLKGLKTADGSLYSRPCIIKKNGKVGVYVLTPDGGKLLIPITYDDISINDCSRGHGGYITQLGDKSGYVMPNGEDVLECLFDDIRVRRGVIETFIGDKCGLAFIINRKIEVLLDCIYDHLDDRIFRLGDKVGKWAIVNKRPQIVIPPIYDSIDKWVVELDGKYGFVGLKNDKLELILECEYDSINVENNKVEDFYCDDNGEYQTYLRETGTPHVVYAEKDSVIYCYKYVDKQWVMVEN